MIKQSTNLFLLVVFLVTTLNAQNFSQYEQKDMKLNIENALGFSSTLKEPNVGVSFSQQPIIGGTWVYMFDQQLENFGWPQDKSQLFGFRGAGEYGKATYSCLEILGSEDYTFSTSCYDNWDVCEIDEDNSDFPILNTLENNLNKSNNIHLFKRKLLKNLINYAKLGEKGYISIKNIDYTVKVGINFSLTNWWMMSGVRLPGLDEITSDDLPFFTRLYQSKTGKITDPDDDDGARHFKSNISSQSYNTKGLKALDVFVNRVRVYPNPSQTGQLTLGIASVTSGNMLFYIRDIQGNVHLKKKVHVEEGTQEIEMPLDSKLNTGIYIVEVNLDQIVTHSMLVIK
jgi:hypothetical protein